VFIVVNHTQHTTIPTIWGVLTLASLPHAYKTLSHRGKEGEKKDMELVSGLWPVILTLER
jgi:hypothetical protein